MSRFVMSVPGWGDVRTVVLQMPVPRSQPAMPIWANVNVGLFCR
jgi:hypothetical protein